MCIFVMAWCWICHLKTSRGTLAVIIKDRHYENLQRWTFNFWTSYYKTCHQLWVFHKQQSRKPMLAMNQLCGIKIKTEMKQIQILKIPNKNEVSIFFICSIKLLNLRFVFKITANVPRLVFRWQIQHQAITNIHKLLN